MSVLVARALTELAEDARPPSRLTIRIARTIRNSRKTRKPGTQPRKRRHAAVAQVPALGGRSQQPDREVCVMLAIERIEMARMKNS